MAYTHRTNSASLFVNRERKNDNAPQLTGSGLLELADGSFVELDIAAWTRESPKAGKWLSLSIKLKDATRQARPSNGRQHVSDYVNQHGTAFDDEGIPPDDKDIPF